MGAALLLMSVCLSICLPSSGRPVVVVVVATVVVAALLLEEEEKVLEAAVDAEGVVELSAIVTSGVVTTIVKTVSANATSNWHAAALP